MSHCMHQLLDNTEPSIVPLVTLASDDRIDSGVPIVDIIMMLLQILPCRYGLLLIGAYVACVGVIRWRMVYERHRRAVLCAVRVASDRSCPANDDAWRRIHVIRWWGHAWVWVSSDLCADVDRRPGDTDCGADAGVADSIASIWHGRACAGGWRVIHIRIGGRR